jgi:hypothetical protein
MFCFCHNIFVIFFFFFKVNNKQSNYKRGKTTGGGFFPLTTGTKDKGEDHWKRCAPGKKNLATNQWDYIDPFLSFIKIKKKK